jgi:hypothetical protein
MDAAIPAITSAQILEQILERCIHICSCNFDIHKPNQFAAPTACVQSFLNGAIGVRMPFCDVWVKKYGEDPELSAIVRFIQNPGTLSQHSLDAANLDPNYCQALRRLCLHHNNGILYYHEPIAGSESYANLQVVPKKLRNIVLSRSTATPWGSPEHLLDLPPISAAILNVKRYLINHLLSTIPKRTIFCLSFPSRDRATAPGRYEYKSCYS